MENIDKVDAAKLAQGPSQKESTQLKSAQTEKIGRQKLLPSHIDTPSIEQAQIHAKTFESFLFNQIGEVFPFPTQLVATAHVGLLLEKGLTAFEKGEPFQFTSTTGICVTIEPGEKSIFIQNFISLLAALLQKAEKNTQLTEFFYGLVEKFIKSDTFQSVYPDATTQQKELISDMSKKEAKIAAQTAFLQNPSVATLKKLLR